MQPPARGPMAANEALVPEAEVEAKRITAD